MTELKGPTIGHIYKSPVNVIGTEIENFNVPSLGVRIDKLPIEETGGEFWHILSYKATHFERSWELLYMKMQTFITGLSIGTITHCWLSDYIYDENGHEVWRKPDTIRMIVEKEGDPQELEPTPSQMASTMIDLSLHISRFYPRVFVYHYIGLLLLRTPLLGFNLNAEILLNFFKIGELVTASNLNARPKLKDIITVSLDLRSGYSPYKITEFYKVRSRDAAHDHQQAQNISRELAADCKLWSEELVINDWMNRGDEVVKRSDKPRFPLRQSNES